MQLNDLQKLSAGEVTTGSVNLDALAKSASELLNVISRMLSGTHSLEATAEPTLPAETTVGQLVNNFLIARAKKNASDRYLRTLTVSLRSFSRGRWDKPLSQVTISEIEAWLQKPSWAPRTQQGYLADVRCMFNFAEKRGWMSGNPAEAVETPPVEESPPAIHEPQQVRTVLEFARDYDLDICRTLAIRYFAGLRTSEADRLVESEIKLDRGFIEVTAQKAKTRRRRIVEIQPNLRLWLALGGVVPLRDLSNTTLPAFRAHRKLRSRQATLSKCFSATIVRSFRQTVPLIFGLSSRARISASCQ
jgi:integrase